MIEAMDTTSEPDTGHAVVTARRSGRRWVLESDDYPDLYCELPSLANARAIVMEAIAYIVGHPAPEATVSIRPVQPLSATVSKAGRHWEVWIPGIGARQSIRRRVDAEFEARRCIAEHLNTAASRVDVDMHYSGSASTACPTPGKAAYSSRLEAKIALASTQRSRASRREESRAYRCPCGRWHLTSHPKAGTKTG